VVTTWDGKGSIVANKCFIKFQYLSYGSLNEDDPPAPVIGMRGLAIGDDDEAVLPDEPVFGYYCDVVQYFHHGDSKQKIKSSIVDEFRSSYGDPQLSCEFLDFWL
jgi:hypothetical protein